MQYITLSEKGNSDSPTIGTVAVNENLLKNVKEAIEAHMCGTVLSPLDEEELTKCLDNEPITIDVEMDIDGDEAIYEIEVSETWIYQ